VFLTPPPPPNSRPSRPQGWVDYRRLGARPRTTKRVRIESSESSSANTTAMPPPPPRPEPVPRLQPLVNHPLPEGVPILQRITRSSSRSSNTSSTSTTPSIIPPTPQKNRVQCSKCKKSYTSKYFSRHKCA